MNDREPSEGVKQHQAMHANSLPEATKPATGPRSRVPRYVPRYQMTGKVPFTQEELDEMDREATERATRTPEELKIANDAWLENEGPGRATP